MWVRCKKRRGLVRENSKLKEEPVHEKRPINGQYNMLSPMGINIVRTYRKIFPQRMALRWFVGWTSTEELWEGTWLIANGIVLKFNVVDIMEVVVIEEFDIVFGVMKAVVGEEKGKIEGMRKKLWACSVEIWHKIAPQATSGLAADIKSGY